MATGHRMARPANGHRPQREIRSGQARRSSAGQRNTGRLSRRNLRRPPRRSLPLRKRLSPRTVLNEIPARERRLAGCFGPYLSLSLALNHRPNLNLHLNPAPPTGSRLWLAVGGTLSYIPTGFEILFEDETCLAIAKPAG